MILPPKDLLDILVNLKECINSQLLFDPNGEWRGDFLAGVFGANSFELSYENDRIDFKDFSISPKFKNPRFPPEYPIFECYRLYLIKQVGEKIPNRFFVVRFSAITDELEKLNPLTKESITSSLDVEWMSTRHDFRSGERHIEGRCINNPHIQISITYPNTLRKYGVEHIQSILIESNI